MGKNNRARRAAKARAKASHAPSSSAASARATRPPRPTGSDPHSEPRSEPTVSEPELIAHLLHGAVGARAGGHHELVEAAELELCRRPVDVMRSVASTELTRAVANAWSGGWQPLELLRHARRTASATTVQLVTLAMAVDHAARPAASLDPRWIEQLDAIALPPVGETAWIRAWATQLGLGGFSEVESIIEGLQCLVTIPVIEELIPPPGGSTRRAHRAAPLVAPTPASAAERATLDKIRALLAKAESTTFEAEAEAFTAKAQELMTRHAIDAAMLSGGSSGGGEEPVAVRIWIDDPYVDAKSLLLQLVAQASRCRTVFFSDISATTLIGFRADVTAVEMLYTSLLVQAQASLTNAAKALPAGARQRSRAFRSSFLLAYAHRIGERLETVDAEVIAETEAEIGRSLLPVLQSRVLAVDEAVEQRYGQLQRQRVRGGYDQAGWASGTRAADAAQFVAGALSNARAPG